MSRFVQIITKTPSVLREADSTIAHSPRTRAGSLAARLRGRATARMSTDDIMKLTRGA